jgi:CHAT domain-containing protein
MSIPAKSRRGRRLARELRKHREQPGARHPLERHSRLLKPSVVTHLAQATLAHIRVDAQEAASMAEAVIEVAEAIADQRALALAYRTKANALYGLGRHREAYQIHEQALSIFDSLGDVTEAGRTLSASLQPLLLTGEYDRAFAAAERAREIFTAQSDERRLARLDINVGNIYYRQDRFAEALAAYRRAYDVVLRHNDSEAIAVVLGNLATCLISTGDFQQALDAHRHASEHCERHAMPLLKAQADYNIAYLYFLRGEYSKAIEMLRATRAECKQIGDRYHFGLCNLDLSELYLELNLSGEAAELSRQATAEFESLGLGYEAAKSLAFEAMAAGQQGHAFQSLKSFGAARARFVDEKNQVWPSLIDLYRALVLFNEGRLFEARRLAQAALEFFDRSLLKGKAVLCRLLLARIAQASGDVRTAEAECMKAVESPGAAETPALRHQTHLLLGKMQAAMGKKEEAHASFLASRSGLETLRGNLRGQELKLAFMKDRLEVYELLVESCLGVPGEAAFIEAFGYMEEAKSRTLMDQMLQPASDGDSGAGQSELVRRMRGLRDELNWYYSLIELEQLRPEQRSPEHMEVLASQVRAREGDLIRVLRESSEAEANEAGLTSAAISIEEFRQTLPENTTALEFFQTGDRILLTLIDRRRVEILPITIAPRVANILRLLQFQLSKYRLGSEYAQMFRDSMMQSTLTHLRALYEELLAPVRARIDCEHLLIVPHGVLHYVPFHALHDGSGFIIDRCTVSYAPSASVFAACARRQATASGPALLMGVPDEKAPSIRTEIEQLGALMPGSLRYVGASASEYILRSHGPASRYVHIATHGFFRQDSPMFSSIRLGNSHLSLYDLYQLKLPVELVTLSGCATGLNVVASGDEVIGLSRGLFQAGAESLLLSLWDVHDRSTAEFMKLFYSALQSGRTKAQAVREAMLEVRESYPHPHQWAPFVLMGKV